MRLQTTYREILRLSLPLMVGSAVQNIIALSDSVFLYHLSEEDFAAIGLISAFYLVVAAIGYGFSKGGQIIIARRIGEQRWSEVGRSFYSMLFFELFLALVLFGLMQWGVPQMLHSIVSSEVIYEKCLAYLKYRSWGVFFSYAGVSIIALYMGAGRVKFLFFDTILLAVTNVILDYGLVFGHFGLPAMGISGAALASTLAEVFALLVFWAYIVFFDQSAREYGLFKRPSIDMELIKTQLRISAPIVAQVVVGLGSWFVFFTLIEQLGERELAISNLVRLVYLTLSVPIWGFSTGLNTLVSYLIGSGHPRAVFPVVWKTAKLSFVVTLLLTLPFVLFPEWLLYPVLGSTDMSLITDAHPVLWVMAGILLVFSIGGIFLNGLAGTGATFFGLMLQTTGVVLYLIAIYYFIVLTQAGLSLAWSVEIYYWVFILAISAWYLKSLKWKGKKV